MREHIEVNLEENGAYWRARWTGHDGKQHSKSMGNRRKVKKTTARSKCNDLEHKLNKSPGMANGNRPPTLAEWLATDQAENVNLKASTLDTIDMAGRYMLAHWPPDVRLDELTSDEAHRFAARLAKGELTAARSSSKFNWHGDRTPAPATVARHLRTCKAILGRARRRFRDQWRLRNPFEDITGAPPEVGARTWHYVSSADLAELLDACPSDAWRAFVKLMRIEGLRKSEALELRKRHLSHLGEPNMLRYGAVTLEIFGTIDVPTLAWNKRGRTVPIFERALAGELAELIEDVDGDELVITDEGPGSVARNCTRKRFLSIIAAAELDAWSPAFQTLRRNAEADLANRGLPQYAVSRWIGHSMKVSERYYLADPTTPGSGSTTDAELKLVG